MNQLEKRPEATPIMVFKRELELIAAELPTSNAIPIERMKSAIMVAVQKTPQLLMADRSTLWQSARMCAADGLLPDGREAAFVIFKTKKRDERGNEQWVDAVQYIPMVYGLRKRAMNSGDIKDLEPWLVYEGEWNAGRFKMVAGDNPRIEHEPIIDGAPGEPERGRIIGGYAVATFRNGDVVRQWMSMADIEKRRRAAASQKIYEKGKPPRTSDEPIGVWKDWFEEQCLKTLVRALSKKLPLSSDDMRAIMESDHDMDEAAAPTAAQIHRPSLEERLRAAQQPAREAEVLPPLSSLPEFDEGVEAHVKGLKEADNPHDGEKGEAWLHGWREAQLASMGDE